ncbi:uncharacterized protein LOC127904941 [Populus trichocarpa]|uniref:uncharacterized protein LOC127904941 n=1 Tax=Populus trichocarpa TaxID=3694 RepID=UPI00227925FB|nr:uncharacterized protein LOC127904941 [Populus trichocarpa]
MLLLGSNLLAQSFLAVPHPKTLKILVVHLTGFRRLMRTLNRKHCLRTRVAVSTVLQCRRSRVVFSNPKQRYKPSAAATTKSHPPAAALAAATTTRLLALATPQQQYQQISSHASSPITTRKKLSEED